MRAIKILAVSSLFFAASALAADVPSYQVVKEKSFLKFIAIQNNAPLEGQFKDYTATIKFDAEQLEKSSIDVDVATGSVSVSYDEAEKNIRLPDWLGVEKFPHATFKSKTITRMPMSENYYADGDLTLRGKTVPATLNFQLQTFDKTAIANGYMTLRRNEFGIGQGEWKKDDVIKNEVRVEFRITANK